MKLGWVHDYRLDEFLGGAQLNNEVMLAAAPDGVEIVRCDPGQMRLCDAYVLHNVRRFSRAELKMATSQPYVKSEHDYWETPFDWQRDWIGRVMNEAAAVIFLSPLHREAFLRQHPEVKPKKVYLVPSPMDPNKFGTLRFGTSGQAGKRGTCWLGEFQAHKGIRAACEWAAEHGTVDFYGFGPVTPAGKNVRVMGKLPYEDVPRTLARYERFLFLPEGVEPFGRVVAEAVLSGCEMLVVNERIGVLSWGWETREDWARGVGTAAERFWEVVGKVLDL